MKGIFVAALLGLLAFGSARGMDFSFGRPTRVTLARSSAANVAIGDANGDGRQDLAVTSIQPDGTHQLSLFLQKDDGTLAAPATAALPFNAIAVYPVAFADLDADGLAEVVVGDPNDGLIVARPGTGGGLSLLTRPTGRGCMFLATGDIDGDGNVDIACHNVQTTATIFYGDGHGGFRATFQLQTGAGTYTQDFKTIRLADVTGDGRLDLLVTASTVNSFFVLANDGFGGFWPATAYLHPASPSRVWPAALEVLDIDGDGVNEVVTASPDNQPDSMLNVYRAGGNGYLALSQRIPIYDSTTALAVGDVDGDGDRELVAGHLDFNAVTLFDTDAGIVGQARFDLPGFGNELIFQPTIGHSNALGLGDVNGDGCLDLAGATYSGTTVLYGCRPFFNQVPVSDYDGDGVADVLWRLPETGENLLYQWADPVASAMCGLACWFPVGQTWKAQAAGDFNADGNSDAFWRDSASGANEIWFGALYEVPITAVTNQDWQVVGAGDFDGDDRSDLLWRNGRTGANTIWKSAVSTIQQTTAAVTDVGWRVAGVGDFNGDRQSDILWRHVSSGRNAIWLSGRSDRQQAIAAVTNPQWKVAGIGDFNGDRKDDVVWRNAVTGVNAIWLSANNATQRPATSVTNMDWDIVAVADYNGDGRSDLFWRNRKTGANTVWRGGDSTKQQAIASTDPQLQVVP